MGLMTVVVMFDCDGTLEIGNPSGYVRREDLDWLVSKGFIAVNVSESPNCASLNIPRVIAPGNRLQALLKAKEQFKPDACVYVSDNPGDNVVAKQAGCLYVHPEFWSEFRWLLIQELEMV